MIHQWKGFQDFYIEVKNLILLKENAQLGVSAVMFYKQFLACTVHIDWSIILFINIQVGLNMHLPI